jgi:hypothetical protein
VTNKATLIITNVRNTATNKNKFGNLKSLFYNCISEQQD